MRKNLDQGVLLLPAECCGPCAGLLLIILLLASSLLSICNTYDLLQKSPSLLHLPPARAPHCLLAKALCRDLKVVSSKNFGHGG